MTANACASAMRRSARILTVLTVNQENAPVRCPTGVRNGARAMRAGPVGLFARRVGHAMSGPILLKPARHAANGTAINPLGAR